MRRALVVADDAGITTAATPTTTASPAAVVEALYDAFGAGDLDAMLALVDSQVDWSAEVSAPGAERVPTLHNGVGHDDVRRYFSGVAELEFHVFESRAFHIDGDVVLVELVLEFSHRRTGRRARIDEIHRFVVRDGKIVHYRPYCDTAAFIEVFRP